MADHEWKTSNVPGMYYCYNCNTLGFWNRNLKQIETSSDYKNRCLNNDPQETKKV